MKLLSETEKKILAEIYLWSIRKGQQKDFVIHTSIKIMVEKDYFELKLKSLEEKGLVTFSNGSYLLTEKGRSEITVVMAGGAFEIIHPGHLETLEKSKALGDVLVVSVARDSTFERNKHRKPFHDEQQRRKLVANLKPVDDAVLGSETDILKTAEFLKPDIIALGYDQSHSDEKITEEIRNRGLKVRVVRLDSSMPEIKSSKILALHESILSET